MNIARARSFFTLVGCLMMFFVASTPVEAALTLCRWRCLRVQAGSPACNAHYGDTSHNTWVFMDTQDRLFESAPTCASGCRSECETRCGGSGRYIGVDASSERAFTVGSSYCIVGEPPSFVLPDIACRSGAAVWNPPTCVEPPPAAPTSTATPAASTGPGTCVFKCARNGVKSAYSGPRIACSTAADCMSCNDACRDGVSGNPSVCVLQNFTPTPTPDELPKCEMAPAGSPTTLTNPLNTTDIGEIIARFIRALTGIAGSLALLMLVVGGVMWMTAEGSDRVGTAQTIIKNACLGLMLIFLAYSLTSLFLLVLGL